MVAPLQCKNQCMPLTVTPKNDAVAKYNIAMVLWDQQLQVGVNLCKPQPLSLFKDVTLSQSVQAQLSVLPEERLRRKGRRKLRVSSVREGDFIVCIADIWIRGTFLLWAGSL